MRHRAVRFIHRYALSPALNVCFRASRLAMRTSGLGPSATSTVRKRTAEINPESTSEIGTEARNRPQARSNAATDDIALPSHLTPPATQRMLAWNPQVKAAVESGKTQG